MKMNLSIYLLFIFVSSIGYSQKMMVNKNIKIEQTKISIENENSERERLYCYDMIKSDTISVSVGRGGLEGYVFILKFVNGEISPKVYKWTDTNSYDGKSSVDLETSKYTLEINDTVLKPGDTLKAKFTILTQTHKYSEKKKVTGEIFHIIGGNMYEWKNGKPIHDKFWKNGERVYTAPESRKD